MISSNDSGILQICELQCSQAFLDETFPIVFICMLYLYFSNASLVPFNAVLKLPHLLAPPHLPMSLSLHNFTSNPASFRLSLCPTISFYSFLSFHSHSPVKDFSVLSILIKRFFIATGSIEEKHFSNTQVSEIVHKYI